MPASFLKPALRGFHPYVPGQQPPDGERWVKLNTNEAPWPPSPRVLSAIRAAVDESLRLYPSPLSMPAREAIARCFSLRTDQVALGNGADELIEMCFRAFAGTGEPVAFTHPSYPLFEPLCPVHEARPSPHPLGTDWELPESFSADPAPLKFLVNPNSPTGTWVDRSAVEALVERSSGVVVLDEAYVDFAPEDRLDLVAEGRPNLLLLRTFSKASALAGMRIGYALGHADLIAALDLVKDSYNLDRLAIAAVVAAIQDQEYRAGLVGFVTEERAWLTEQLQLLGFQVSASATNFVFARPPARKDAAAIHAELRKRHVLVRHYDREPIAGWFRITIGTRDQHQALLEALKEAMA